MQSIRPFALEQIGIIRTPYLKNAPYQPLDTDEQGFRLEISGKYVQGLKDLDKFNYIYVLFWADRVTGQAENLMSPPWADGRKVGIFSSRSPARPNPIGLSIVRVNEIIANKIYTSGLDVFDKTPLLDIKPYIKDLDNKDDANYGWIGEMDDMEHLSLHIRGVPHDY